MSACRSRAGRWLASAWCALAQLACDGSPAAPAEPPVADASIALTREQLLDPASCKGCHPRHYREWQSSMHAYAADDPVFRAMNQRGQRETDGELGDFCVRCHAPLAVQEGATTDGLNLDSVPASLRGVTCYFCHNVESTGDHAFNNPLVLANDTRMRAAIADPVDNPAHQSGYSPHQDRNRKESSRLCGGCHDVVMPSGVKLERTFQEYEESLFAQPGVGFETCSGCHMPGRIGRAAEGAPERSVHEHLWPGVDVALDAFPDRTLQQRAVECELSLQLRILSIGVSGLGELSIKLETQAGHHQPSGTAHDRRLWLEVVAYDAQDRVLFESGVIGDREREEKAPGEPGYDPNLAMFRDWIYGADGQPVHMFWDVAPSALYPDGHQSVTLPPMLRLDTPHALEARFRIFQLPEVQRVTVRTRMRPVGMDVLQDLVDSGDLDPQVLHAMPTYTLHGASLEWYPLDGARVELSSERPDCPDHYRCLLDGECEE